MDKRGCNVMEYDYIKQGDCFELMKQIPDGSVDLVLTDPPYGIMKGAPIDTWKRRNEFAEWDTTLDTQTMFAEISRILRRNGKCVLFCQEPYTSHLITNVPPSMLFCYRGIWLKNCNGNSLMAKTAMTSRFEDFCVFANKNSGGLMNKCVEKISDVVFGIGFNKFAEIMFGEGRYKDIASAKKNLYKKVYIEGCNEYDKNFFDESMYHYLQTQIKMPYTFDEYFSIVAEYKAKTKSVFNLWQGGRSKSNVLEYAKDNDGYHPTQKPVKLLEDLIQTYSNEGNLVLDFTMDSGSTCVACVNTNRHYIGFEKEPKYYDIACKRIEEVERVKTMSKENCCDKIIPTKSVHIENMNEAQLEQEIAKSNRKLERLQKTMNANLGGDTQDVGLIPLNQINGYNDKNKNSEEAKRKSDKQITSTVNKAVAYTKAKADYDAEKKRNKVLNEALNTVKGTGKTTKQIKDEKLAKIAKNSTMKWEKSTQKGQFGNVTIRKSGAYEIRTGAMSHIYKNGEQIGITNKLKDAIAFVELHNKRGENNG